MQAQSKEDRIWRWLAEVPDPEVPALSVVDLGMIRQVRVEGDRVEVDVSPTYTGCPATEAIEHDILAKLRAEGIGAATVRRVLSPPWTTDWISEEGREKLRAYGIAPPARPGDKRGLLGKSAIRCPRCQATETTLVSEFGSTACKASYRCNQCREPFEYFKCI